MKALKFMLVVCFAVTITLPVRTIVEGQEAPLSATEAPTGFDNVSNGFTTATQFKKDKDIFEDREEIANGLGPTYNAQSCAECHQNPVTGGISQVTELRAGHLESEVFVPAAGGSLIHSRATDASIEEFVEEGENIRSFRTSLNTLGDGFVECIDDQTLINISLNQPRGMQGLYFNVPVLEAGKMLRLGRFGWKNQHASLVSFSSDAYLNEMGITNSIGTGDNAVE